MNQLLDTQVTDLEEDQTNEQEEPTKETTLVLWDWAVPTLGLKEEEQAEEIQVSSVKITTRSKGIVVDQILVFPKVNITKETMKRNIGTTRPQHKVNPENIKETILVINKHVKNVENKPESTNKGMEEYNMGYDIVEDIKNTK